MSLSQPAYAGNHTQTKPDGWRLGTPQRQLESAPVHEDEEADSYDRMTTRHRGLLNTPFVDLVCAAGKMPCARVLDIGCGPGWIAVELARRNPGWEIVAVDPSASMRARGMALANRVGVSNRVNFETGEAGSLPGASSSFDIVISNFVLHHLPNPVEMLNAAARMRRPGGRVLIKDLLRPPAWQFPLLLNFSRYVLRYDALQLQLYRESLHAALTFPEIRMALAKSHLHAARLTRFRVLDYLVEG